MLIFNYLSIYRYIDILNIYIYIYIYMCKNNSHLSINICINIRNPLLIGLNRLSYHHLVGVQQQIGF